MKIVANLVNGYKHSPGDVEQSEEYPIHLKEVKLLLYNKLMKSAEEPALNISKENYEM